MDWYRVLNGVLKGLIGSGIAAAATLGFHQFILPSKHLPWALIAVAAGSFFSGFFAETTGKIACESEEEGRKDEYLAVGSTMFILGITNIFDNQITSLLFVSSGGLFIIAAYRESDTGITDYFG